MNLLGYTVHIVEHVLLPLFVVCLLLLLAGDVELNPGPKENIKNEILICQLNIHSLKERFSTLRATLPQIMIS